MKKLIYAAVIAGLIGCSAASTESAPKVPTIDVSAMLPDMQGAHVWQVDMKKSKLSFEVTASRSDYNVRSFTAEFSNFAAAINLNPDDLSTAKITAIVDTSSAQLEDKLRAENWNEPAWLATEGHPSAKFMSREVIKTEDGKYRAEGELTIKGTAKPAALVFDLAIDGNQASAKGEMTISRMDFNVGTGSDFKTEDNVHFDVKIMTEIIANKQ